MKIKLKNQPPVGDTKEVEKFAWLPTVVGTNDNRYLVWFDYYTCLYEHMFDGTSGHWTLMARFTSPPKESK